MTGDAPVAQGNFPSIAGSISGESKARRRTQIKKKGQRFRGGSKGGKKNPFAPFAKKKTPVSS